MQQAEPFYSSTGERAVSALGVEQRAAFLTKTYNHLFGAILGFTAIEVLLFKTGMAEDISRTLLSGSWMLVLMAFMLVSWMARSVAHRARSRVAQYMALGGYVLAQALIFVPLLFMANGGGRAEYGEGNGVIASAAMTTILGFALLTGIVFYTRKDFSFLRAFLGFASILVLALIVFSALTGFSLGNWFSLGMVVFAGGAILYDTSNVLHHYPEDSYVAASLELFASIAMLFWYVLRIFMSRD